MPVCGACSGPKIVGFARLLAGLVALVVALSACSSPPERVPVLQPDLIETPEPTRTEVVAQSPTVVATAVPTISDQVERDEISSLTTLEAGEQAVDESGNLITVHGIRRVPASLETTDAFDLGGFDLFADTEALVGSTSELAMLDVAMCAAGDFTQNPAGSVEFLAAPSTDDLLDEAANLFTTHALVAPGFVFPAPGECSRGWVPVDLAAGSTDPVGRYVLIVAGGTEGLGKHVYQWPVEPDQNGSGATTGFARGEVVTFNEGPLIGTTVTFSGWSELFDAPAPAGTRMVGTLLTVCPATEDWPEFGVSVDGWNLFGPVDPADRLGADPLAPISGDCFEDWAEFAVPFGAAPTGFFVSDGRDPVNGFAQWSFDGAAIEGPT